MTERRDAETAIAKLNGAELHGRALNVNEARPKPTGSSGFGGGRQGSGRGGGGRGSSGWVGVFLVLGGFMGGAGPQTFKKKQKEQRRKEKQEEKHARRLARKGNRSFSETDQPHEPVTVPADHGEQEGESR